MNHHFLFYISHSSDTDWFNHPNNISWRVKIIKLVYTINRRQTFTGHIESSSIVHIPWIQPSAATHDALNHSSQMTWHFNDYTGVVKWWPRSINFLPLNVPAFISAYPDGILFVLRHSGIATLNTTRLSVRRRKFQLIGIPFVTVSDFGWWKVVGKCTGSSDNKVK
jgi:hypothetical protein